MAPRLSQQGTRRSMHSSLPGRSGQAQRPPGGSTQREGQHGLLPQLRSDPPVASGHLRCQLFAHRDEGSAQAGRRQLPQGERLLVESRPGQTARLRQADRTAPARGETPSCPTDAPLLRRCVSSRLGPGPGVLLLAAGRPAFAGGYGLRTQAAEHPRRLLPRRPRIHRLPVDAGQHQRRTVRQLPATCCGRCIPRPSGASSCTWTGHATTAAPLSRSGCDGIRSFTCRRSRHTPPTST